MRRAVGVSSQHSVERWPASCPRCGFDMEKGKGCRVCGYDPAREQSRKPQVTQNGRAARLPFILVLAAAAFLLARGAVLLIHGLRAQTAVYIPKAEPVTVSRFDSSVVRLDSAATSSAILSTGGHFEVASRANSPPFSDGGGFVDWMVKHTDQQMKFLSARWDRAQIAARLGNMKHEAVREAFLRSPREYFCRNPRRAYENAALPIGYGQTISGPHLVARMTDYLNPQPGQKVLEIGTGSGYNSALLSEITNHVFTVEIVEELARETDAIFKRLEPKYPEYRNIMRKIDDGYYGWPVYAPFDRIIVTCGNDHVPPLLMSQWRQTGSW